MQDRDVCKYSGNPEHRGEAPNIVTAVIMGHEKRLVRLSYDFKIEENFAGTDCTEGTVYTTDWRSVRTRYIKL